MKKVIYLVPDTCLECRYFDKFEYLENGVSKPIEIPDRVKTAKVTVTLKPDGTKRYVGRCGVYGGLIKDGNEMLKKYEKSLFSIEHDCSKEFPMNECTIEQFESATE